MVENPLHALLHDAVEELVSREPLGRVGFPKGGCVVTPEDIDTDPPATDPMEAERASYEEACEHYYGAKQLYLEAQIAWGTDYAKEHYHVGDVPVPPCDGSYTDQWESTDAIHGPLYLSWWAATVIKRADPPEGALEVAALCGGSYTDPWESTEAIHGPLHEGLAAYLLSSD